MLSTYCIPGHILSPFTEVNKGKPCPLWANILVRLLIGSGKITILEIRSLKSAYGLCPVTASSWIFLSSFVKKKKTEPYQHYCLLFYGLSRTLLYDWSCGHGWCCFSLSSHLRSQQLIPSWFQLILKNESHWLMWGSALCFLTPDTKNNFTDSHSCTLQFLMEFCELSSSIYELSGSS